MKTPKYIKEKPIKCLIVGAGLAGCCLFRWLNKQGVGAVLVTNHEKAASHVAAGLVNPLTGRNVVKTWMCDTLLPFTKSFFEDEAQFFGKPFFFQKPIVRYFDGVEMENDLIAKTADPAYESYLSVHTENKINLFLTSNYTLIKQGGYVDIQEYINEVNLIAKKFGKLKSQHFNWQKLQFDRENPVYENEQFDFVIDCTGMGVKANPFFKNLPINGTKGELLGMQMEGIDEKHIYHKGVFLFMHTDGLFRVGATYQSSFKDALPTTAGKEKILKKLKDFCSAPHRLVEHWSGIRPSTKDRRPIAGFHPKFKRIGILNGLGSKGTTLGPWLAFQLSRKILYGGKIHPQASLERFSEQIS